MTEKLSAKEFDINYYEICKRIENAAKKSSRNADDIILLAATKTVDAKMVNYAISKGINYIGENRVQEFLSKNDDITDVHKHFIGHLQTNKVKDIIDKVELIHSVDSLKLAREISNQAIKKNITVDILLEVNIAGEESKWGFKEEEIPSVLQELSEFEGIKVKGLMAIPPICDKSEENRKYFRKMHKLFVDISNKNKDNSSMEFLSMGMSDDFDVAIEEGANIVRLGTALFGKRK